MGLYRDNGKENGNYYSIMGSISGLYRDNGNLTCILKLHPQVILHKPNCWFSSGVWFRGLALAQEFMGLVFRRLDSGLALLRISYDSPAFSLSFVSNRQG